MVPEAPLEKLEGMLVPNLSHSDYLNLPVTVDNKLLAELTITELPE